ncbi:MAG: glutathione S-transferase family protein [Hoeflea sp.]|uniref:glutathione S-transferase family protein n=1 Tax=Hoeflea sp. TaxID=1940281 RepID=UPI003EF7F684
MPKLTLVSHHLCPYVQRAAIALVEKGVPFERVTIDLANKPDWFVAISPLGKVPLLQVEAGDGEDASNAGTIFESAVILEYLEETQVGPLHPTDPLARARARSWIEFASAMLNGIARLYVAPDHSTFDSAAAGLNGMADQVEAELDGRSTGHWFGGSTFGLVDAAFGPVFRYFDTFEAEASLRLLDGRPLLAAWRLALAERPSVRSAVSPDYPERLKQFLLARHSFLSRQMVA